MTKRITVVGAGYVGLTTALCLATSGHRVVCADIDARRIAELRAGRSPIHEPGIDDMLHDRLADGSIEFADDTRLAVRDAEFVFLCLPTPPDADGSPDLSYLEAAVRSIGPVLLPGTIVVNKSTVPIGSARVVEEVLRRDDVAVVSNPEFLREGSALRDFLHPDRIVIGSTDPVAAARVGEVFRDIPGRVLITDPESAELIKYASNAFLAMKLTYANEIARLCESFGADAGDVLEGMGSDERIGRGHLMPGPGWGGSCLPKDSRALLRMAMQRSSGFPLLSTMLETNESRFDRVVDTVERRLEGGLHGARVAVWGLTFKADTDDRRDSPALAIIGRLAARGATVVAFDPTVLGGTAMEGCSTVDSELDAVRGADVLVILTEWERFRSVDAGSVAAELVGRSVVDTRNVVDAVAYRSAGLVVLG